MTRCAYCGWYMHPGETVHYSKLNGANNIPLCQEDAEREEDIIALHGSKTLPDRLQSYTMR